MEKSKKHGNTSRERDNTSTHLHLANVENSKMARGLCLAAAIATFPMHANFSSDLLYLGTVWYFMILPFYLILCPCLKISPQRDAQLPICGQMWPINMQTAHASHLLNCLLLHLTLALPYSSTFTFHKSRWLPRTSPLHRSAVLPASAAVQTPWVNELSA